MSRKANVFLCGVVLSGVAGLAGYRALAAPMRTQSFFFGVQTKRDNPDVSHTVGVVASSQVVAEDLALDYAAATWGGSGWYVGGTTTNCGEVHVNDTGAQ